MTIQYFVAHPPRIAALELDSAWTVGEWMENLQQVPGVHSVTARISDEVIYTRISDEVIYTVTPRKGAGDPFEIRAKSKAAGRWIISIVTQSLDYDGSPTFDVRYMAGSTVSRLYRAVDNADLLT
jgi:hypothetical protein